MKSYVSDEPKSFDLKFNSFYIAGLSYENIYLGDNRNSGRLIVTNYSFTFFKEIILKIPDSVKFAWRAAKILIKYPYVYLVEGITPCIFKGSFPAPVLKKLNIGAIKFDSPIPLTGNNIAFRTRDFEKDIRTITKFNFDSGNFYTAHVLEKQNDGFFSTDGMFLIDSASFKLVYLYYYRNNYILLDTFLHLIAKLKTIDTVTQANVKTMIVPSEKTIKLSSPPKVINKNACTCDSQLFVQSLLMADNENPIIFKQSSVFDVYSIEKTAYLFSFYINDPSRYKIREFKIIDKKMVVLQDKFILCYQIQSGIPDTSFKRASKF